MNRFFIVVALVLTGSMSLASAQPVVVYSARNEQLIKPLFDQYTKETGVPVQFITGSEGPLLARLRAEGANTSADVLLTVDAGNLWQAANEGLLRPLQSPSLQASVPAHLRDPGNSWFGLSVRARTIVYNTARVKPTELSTYEDLAAPKWHGRLCLRTSKKVYNQSLVAMLIAEHGESATQAIVQGWVNNLAVPVFADDTKAIEAVAQGQCDVTLVNTYYFGRLLQKSPQLPVAIFWPNQNVAGRQTGVHVNVSGAGVTRHAKNPAGGQKLIEWLASGKAQSLFADSNLEYPVNPQVAPAPAVAAWGTFKHNPINVKEAGSRQVQSVQLMDRARYK
ncbi:MAG: Fe(3+) ABC transporter substrate-binding protein [Comamonadaceae bacterium CG1_02_60_18]|nr:MAG: Fe(3+) ABC transporter substrate-binding protein [Comamonadaceae bacterium CG1_02_60_18]PIQ52116.1 MAG: Fe(3+) ABC transporter substrate-binding protein [Comamonadaceae bacterium CG12_big_fil_rev_8_21_14_0_65_59_15]